MIEIAGEGLTAAINPMGAELSSLRDAEGREWMTDADPAFWTGRAPLLFPIVGRLYEDRYRLDGQDYALPQHGFARRQRFELIEQGASHASFRLTDNEASRPVYPFAFALDAAFVIENGALAMAVTVTNRDTRPMPASFGYHPAFAWPLPGADTKDGHRIVFERDEPADLAALANGGWIAPDGWPSPLADGRTLELGDDLFERDALVWDRLESRALRYESPGAAIEVEHDAPMLGIWTKPGARFVCIEPWWGIADPHGFAGELWDKPGIMRFEPGEARSFTMRVKPRAE